LLIPIPVFAQSDDITNKHWFISGWDSCTTRNEQSLNFYETLTPQYLSKYDIHGVQTSGKCVTLSDVQNDIDAFTDALQQFDLPIIILDSLTGIEHTLTTDALGHYIWQGNDQVIIISSLSPYIESDTGAWTLSHELAHFALNHKNYPMNIVGGWVHDTESQARSCLGDDLSINACPELWTTVQAPSGKNIKMMKIYSSESEPTSELEKLLAEMNNPPSQSLETGSSECFSYYMANQFSDAISCYTFFLFSNPDDTNAMSWLGRSHEGQSEYNKALNTFSRINALEPNNVNGLSGIARNYDALGKCEKAIPYYEKTLLIEPDHIEAKIYINLAPFMCKSTSAVAESQVFDIKPIISNGFITKYEMISSQNKLKLSVSMDSGKSGETQIVLPRELLDSKSSGNDVPFKVTVGGKSVAVDEIATTDSERVIKFPISSTTSTIIITGSESYPNAVVVPEFGSITMLILVVSIVAVMVSVRKFQMIK